MNTYHLVGYFRPADRHDEQSCLDGSDSANVRIRLVKIEKTEGPSNRLVLIDGCWKARRRL